jgi:serine/threonine protein kinase
MIVQMSKGGVPITDFRIAASEYAEWFRGLRNLMVGLQKIHPHGLGHNDIKPDNIVTMRRHNGTFLTRFIDLGLSLNGDIYRSKPEVITKPDGKKKYPWAILTTNYAYWPFEMRLLYHIFREKYADPLTDVDALDDNIYEFYDNQNWRRETIPYKYMFKRHVTSDYAQQLARSLDIMSVDERVGKVSRSTDIWGLARTLGYLYHSYVGHRDRGVDDIEVSVALTHGYASIADLHLVEGWSAERVAWHREVAKHISRPMFALLRKMLVSKMEERIGIDEVLAAYDAILVEMDRLFTADAVWDYIKEVPLSPIAKEAHVLGAASSSPHYTESPAAAAAAGGAGVAILGVADNLAAATIAGVPLKPLPPSPALAINANAQQALAGLVAKYNRGTRKRTSSSGSRRSSNKNGV